MRRTYQITDAEEHVTIIRPTNATDRELEEIANAKLGTEQYGHILSSFKVFDEKNTLMWELEF